MTALAETLIYILISIISINHASSPPNVILIMMDDLGYTDINYNGGIVPTPNLNKFSSEGIKINYHYANTICSASRSSLLTGRYAWRTGAANIIYQQTTQHTSLDLPFISNILKESKYRYNTAMFGKYHLGYSSQEYLPFNRGFDKTLFFEAGATIYSTHESCPSWGLIFNAMKINVDQSLQQQIMDRFQPGFCSHDLWNEKYEPIEGSIYVEGVYNERLFTNGIKSYIESYSDDDDNNNNPFFIYYAMPTPHWPLQDPPKLYDECDNEEIFGDRKAFCNVLMYGDELIGEIVDSLKNTNQYENTVIIFLSDNGPNPNWKSDIKLPGGYGQTLPLRGAKGSTFEGGIRTPAFMYGGYLENKNCKNIGGEYNNMVHISDWFAIIKSMANINDNDDDFDVDIDGIDLFPDICNNDGIVQREIIKHFEMIDVNEKEQGFKASYIRTNEWKLLINSSLSFVEIPSNKYWVDYDDSFTTSPPKDKYEMMKDVNKDIFHSQCYDDYLMQNIDDDSISSVFEYDDIMLFKIGEDNIEACNVANENPKIVKHLLNQLFNDENIEQYVLYNSEEIKMSKQGTLAQIESYDCLSDKSYHLSWHEIEKYSNEDNVDLSWNQIFQKMIDIKDSDCKLLSKDVIINNNNNNNNNNNYDFIINGIIILIVSLSLISFLWITCRIFRDSWNKFENKIKSIDDENEHTALLQ